MFFIILLFTAQISYAKYVSTEILHVTQEIAYPIIQIKEGSIVQIDENNNIGYYEFSIKNYEQDKVSELNFLYTIEIVSDLKYDVKFELYRGEQQILLENLKTNKIAINKSKKEEQKYILKIIYNPEMEAKEDGVKQIQIKIYSEQEKI